MIYYSFTISPNKSFNVCWHQKAGNIRNSFILDVMFCCGISDFKNFEVTNVINIEEFPYNSLKKEVFFSTDEDLMKYKAKLEEAYNFIKENI